MSSRRGREPTWEHFPRSPFWGALRPPYRGRSVPLCCRGVPVRGRWMGTQGGECQGQVGPCVGVQGSLIFPVRWRTPPSGHLPSPKRNRRCLGALPGGGRALARETSDAELFEGGTLFIDCLCGSEVGLASGFYRSLGLGRGRRADPELGVETSAEEILWSRSRTPALLCHQCSEVAPRWTAGGVCHSHQCLLHPQTHSRRVARSHRPQRARCPRQPPSSPARPPAPAPASSCSGVQWPR